MKRCLHIDYQKLEGAKTHKRVLHLLPEDGIQQETYVCPVGTCLHDPYKSVRGLRKHINSIHPWYFYFDEPPRIQRKEAVHLPQKKFKASTHSMPAFSITTGIGQEFLQWLMTPCGGGRSNSESQQQARRGMKFLSFSESELESQQQIILNVPFISRFERERRKSRIWIERYSRIQNHLSAAPLPYKAPSYSLFFSFFSLFF